MEDDKPYEYVGFPEKYEKYCNEKLNEIIPYLNKEDFILDAGCGGEKHPYCFLNLEKKFPQIIGIDLNNNWHPKIINQNLLNLLFKDNHFDVCICLDVLEHIYDWQRALNELIRVTKKRVIIIVPTSESKIYAHVWDFFRGCIGTDNKLMFGHYREFFPEQIIKYKNPKIKSVTFKKMNSAAPLPTVMRKMNLLYSGIYIIDLKDGELNRRRAEGHQIPRRQAQSAETRGLYSKRQ